MRRLRYPRGSRLGFHAHREAQLLFASSGTMQVHTEGGRWLVPPQLAVWVPARRAHALDALSDVEMWTIYYDERACHRWAPAAALDREFALRVTPLLRDLILALFDTTAHGEKAELIVRLILHELTETEDAPTFLPLPDSDIGRRVAELALADPGARVDLTALARRAATSPRTISRLFPRETGLTFKAWRHRARIVAAIDRLSGGATIAQAVSYGGFASTAAFAFAFRRVTGMTAGQFLRTRAR
jgi:AraC-like DNA-binding protein